MEGKEKKKRKGKQRGENKKKEKWTRNKKGGGGKKQNLSPIAKHPFCFRPSGSAQGRNASSGSQWRSAAVGSQTEPQCLRGGRSAVPLQLFPIRAAWQPAPLPFGDEGQRRGAEPPARRKPPRDRRWSEGERLELAISFYSCRNERQECCGVRLGAGMLLLETAEGPKRGRPRRRSPALHPLRQIELWFNSYLRCCFPSRRVLSFPLWVPMGSSCVLHIPVWVPLGSRCGFGCLAVDIPDFWLSFGYPVVGDCRF